MVSSLLRSSSTCCHGVSLLLQHVLARCVCAIKRGLLLAYDNDVPAHAAYDMLSRGPAAPVFEAPVERDVLTSCSAPNLWSSRRTQHQLFAPIGEHIIRSQFPPHNEEFPNRKPWVVTLQWSLYSCIASRTNIGRDDRVGRFAGCQSRLIGPRCQGALCATRTQQRAFSRMFMTCTPLSSVVAGFRFMLSSCLKSDAAVMAGIAVVIMSKRLDPPPHTLTHVETNP